MSLQSILLNTRFSTKIFQSIAGSIIFISQKFAQQQPNHDHTAKTKQAETPKTREKGQRNETPLRVRHTNINSLINKLLIITQGVVINNNNILLWRQWNRLHFLNFGLHNCPFCSKRRCHWFHLGRWPISLVRSPGVVTWLVVREVRVIRSGWRGVIWLADPRPCGFHLRLPTWDYCCLGIE